jgi:CubicO group peptidase (beta-lactamase class C family)
MTDRARLEARLAAIGEVFAYNFRERDEIGASVSVWYDGEEVLSLAAGTCEKGGARSWDADTLVPFWSATKGLAAACVLRLLDERGIALAEPVVSVWPEFGTAGKAGISFALALSHAAGLPALDGEVSMFDHAAVVAAIEAQRPLWEPGTAHGYHPRTFGFLLDEIVRRVAGVPLGEYFEAAFREPLGLDLWIGLPQSEHSRVATLYPGKMSDPEGEAAFYRAFGDPTSLTRRAFGSPAGLPAISGMNAPEAWAAGWPAMGGIGTARSLAKFYAMLAGGAEWGGQRIVSENVFAQMGAELVSGSDEVFCLDTAFSAGFMKDSGDPSRRRLFGPSSRAFGHPGAGGSLAFCDPENGLAFAYTMNQMNYGVLPGAKALDMVAALYG